MCQLGIVIQHANRRQKTYCCYVAAALRFSLTQPRSLLQDARYQLLGRKPTDLALSSNRTVSAGVITVTDDTAEYCLFVCDVIQLDEN